MSLAGVRIRWSAVCLGAVATIARPQTALAAHPRQADRHAGATATPEGLTGDWGGWRTRLAEDGVTIAADYISEIALNASGGRRSDVTEAGQFSLVVSGDLDRLAHVKDGNFQLAVTRRRGKDLGRVAGLNVLQQAQEIYGPSETWRLTQLWYEQRFGAFRLKVGRTAPDEEFAAFSCEFENLSLCGSQPGNIVGDYWLNWPISQWGARLRLDRPHVYAQVGVYEVNPKNLRQGFVIGRFHGATGVLIPIEIGVTRKGARAGSYKVGAWYSSADAPELPRGSPVSSRTEPGQRSGRYGAWVQLEHQLTGTAANGQVLSGLSVFLNVVQADRATSLIDQQISAGLFYTGLSSSIRGDVLGLGISRTNINGRAARPPQPGAEPSALTAEYAAEAFYRFRPLPWLALSPNLQLVHRPGARSDARDVRILGLKADLTL